jgi:hypothetical protein
MNDDRNLISRLATGTILALVLLPVNALAAECDKCSRDLLHLSCISTCIPQLWNEYSSGATLGLIGLGFQLWVRGEWPKGQLNVGAPNTLDPMALVLATVASVAAGIAAASSLDTEDAAKIIAVIAIGYIAADLVPFIKKIIALIQKLIAFLGDLMKKLSA